MDKSFRNKEYWKAEPASSVVFTIFPHFLIILCMMIVTGFRLLNHTQLHQSKCLLCCVIIYLKEVLRMPL